MTRENITDLGIQTNYAYENIHYVEIPRSCDRTRMHCIYQNFVSLVDSEISAILK